jgi:TfoX/Sxy family transcriptional regulator of competence genes
MAYDEGLAERVREQLAARPSVAERKMFGGIGWMIGGNMACGVMSDGGLLVRLEPAEAEAAWEEHPHAGPFGREGAKPMKGFVRVAEEGVAEDADLTRWVDAGADFAASLPPK